MTYVVTGFADRLARLALAFISLVVCASCGSGAVSGTPQVNDPARITVLPAVATAFAGLPTTFVISGGTGSYIVSSSNQAVIPVAGGITGGSLTVVPNAVSADTLVTITVRDTGTTPIATTAVTVKPGTVANDITITPSSTQGGGCSPAVCSGGDALVTATISQGGVPLANRSVRFDVVSGDFRFITSAPGASFETTDTSIVVLSDELGKARARIRALSTAPNQSALLQVTDLATGAFQRASFVIAQATGSSPGFFVTPTSVVFQGRNPNECAGPGISATVYIFGGAPPYTVSSTSSAFAVSREFVGSSGGSFDVTPLGQCVAEPGAPIVVRDFSGRTVTTLAANIRGTQANPPLVVGPSSVTLNSCSGNASVQASGGSGTYTHSEGSSSIVVNQFGNTFSISRSNSPPPGGPVDVAISDGTSTETVTVNFTGEGAGACPALTATPASVTLTSCTSFVDVRISGGSGTHTAASDNAGVMTTLTQGPPVVVRIQRLVGSGTFTPPSTVVVRDNTVRSVSITVNATGTAAGPC